MTTTEDDTTDTAGAVTIDVRTEAFANFMADYPFPSEVASFEELPLVSCTTADEGEPFTARVLGFGSSYKGGSHWKHAPGTRPLKGERCSKCRWTDTAILSDDKTDYYVFVSCAQTIVPDEKRIDTVVWTTEAIEVFRNLFVPTKKSFKRDTGSKAISPQNADAFWQAATIDDAFAALADRYHEVIPPAPNPDDGDPLRGL